MFNYSISNICDSISIKFVKNFKVLEQRFELRS